MSRELIRETFDLESEEYRNVDCTRDYYEK